MPEDKPGKILFNCSKTKKAFARKAERYKYYKSFRRGNRVWLGVMTIIAIFASAALYIDYGIKHMIVGFFLVAVICLWHLTVFRPREICRKWESEYDFIIYDNGLLLPEQTFEPKKSVFVHKEKIFKIYWNRGHDYLLILFNEAPKYENKLNRRFELLTKRYIDYHKQCLDTLEKYYGVNRKEILLRENIIMDKRNRKTRHLRQ